MHTAHQVVFLPELWIGRWDLQEWLHKAHTTIRGHLATNAAALQALRKARGGTVDLFVTLKKPPLLGVELRNVPNAAHVARYVDFAPQLHIIAHTIVRRLRRELNTTYDAVVADHARMPYHYTACSMAHIYAWRATPMLGTSSSPAACNRCGPCTAKPHSRQTFCRVRPCTLPRGRMKCRMTRSFR